MTRREWLAEMGAATLAASLPGALPVVATGSQTSGVLPPGLYAPSSQHLGHALQNDALFRAIPVESQTDYARPALGSFQPAFFSEHEFQTVRTMVRIILGLAPGEQSHGEGNREDPEEETAEWIDLRMASAAGVRRAAQALSPEHRTLASHRYGTEAVTRAETEHPEKICREGLAGLDQASEQKYGERFLKLTEAQQIEILESASDQPRADTSDHAGTRFFNLIKGETIRGYYTSRTGLRELNYSGNSFYAASPGCPKSGE